MSDFSLTLVLQIKTSKIINDMAKIQKKSEKISAFGGIFFVLDKFDSILSSVIDSHLGLRSTLIGYQYSEIAGSLSSVYFCGGDCVEDVTSHLMPHLSLHPALRTCSSDTILRAISELATANTAYVSDTGKSYDAGRSHSPARGFTSIHFSTNAPSPLLRCQQLRCGRRWFQGRRVWT